MKTNNSSGRAFAVMVGVWLIIKVVINMLINGLSIGDLPGDIGQLIIAGAEAVLLYLGLKYTNYVIAAIMALTVVIHVPGNISMMFSVDTLLQAVIYLAEGAADIILAVVICITPSIREHFTNTPADLSEK